MVKTTLWRPDTCDCEVFYEWDDDDAQILRTHTLTSIKKCAVHSAVSDELAYSSVKDENTRKNNALGIALQNANIVDETPNGRQLKPGIEYRWQFDSDRKLLVNFTGIDTVTKNSLLSSIVAKLGANKVGSL